jgi:hypothetical protein
MDDKVKIRCPFCTRLFRDRAQRIREGYQVNCEHCIRLITFARDSEDPFMRRALKLARETRTAIEAKVMADRQAAAAEVHRQRDY